MQCAPACNINPNTKTMNFSEFVDNVFSIIRVPEADMENEGKYELQKLQSAAEQGVLSAQFLLGNRYYYGINIEQDAEKAFYWYGRAANDGLAIAQYQLGLICVEGSLCAPDYQLAKAWLELAAAQDLNQAVFLLALLEAKGLVGDGDEEHVFYLMRRSALLGNVDGLVGTALACAEGYGCEACYADAIRWLVDAGLRAEESEEEINMILSEIIDEIKELLPEKDTSVLTAYAYCAELGLGVEKDPAKSVKIYQMAANAGNAFAQNALSHCYMVPLYGLEKDLEKAYYLSAAAAQQGNVSAMVNVGYFYELGEYSEHLGHMDFIKRDLDKAEYWYVRAAEAGHVKANLYLSSVYSRRGDMEV